MCAGLSRQQQHGHTNLPEKHGDESQIHREMAGQESEFVGVTRWDFEGARNAQLVARPHHGQPRRSVADNGGGPPPLSRKTEGQLA